MAVTLAIADAKVVLEPATETPLTRRLLVPDATFLIFNTMPQQLREAIVFEQASGRTDAFEYHISGNVLHWPIRMLENLSACIKPPS